MTLLSSLQNSSRGSGKPRRSHFGLVLLSVALAGCGLSLVIYLLRPTWEPEKSTEPARLPVSVGATLFNVPTDAIRMKVQKHSGPQERVDLSFAYPSLDPPAAPKHLSAESVEENGQPIDRIFLSISAHHDALAPEARLNTIYPRYLEQTSSPGQDGLVVRAFRDGTPYSHEDLFFAKTPALVARCSREAATPGMCLSERRIGGADLTFRFPRRWLTQWSDVAGAMDRLATQLRAARG